MIEILTWAGISYDEGPGKDNSMYGPYVQSMRLDIYKRFAKHLLEGGRAYKCYCSRERLEGLRQVDGHGRYDGHCRNLPLQSPVKGQDLHVVRFRVPPGSVKILDSVYGTSEISNRLVDDAILMKSDGFPTYHFANVIDDHQMSITTVMRGQEWLPSTALHLLLYQAFDWVPPRFMHLPLLINKDGSKLSKRQNDAFVEYYLNKGYFPSALLNFVAFLGWNPPTNRELMSLDDLVKEFNVERINKANPLVDMDKLLWYNQSHLQMILKSNEFRPLIDRLRKCIKDNETFSDDYLLRCIQASSVLSFGYLYDSRRPGLNSLRIFQMSHHTFSIDLP